MIKTTVRFLQKVRWSALIGVVLVTLIGFLLLRPQQASALTFTSHIPSGAGVGLTFSSMYHLTLTYDGDSYTFYDRDPYDSNYNYELQNTDCGADITFDEDDFESSGSLSGTAVLDYEYLDGGDCSDGQTLNINLNREHSNRHYNAFYLDDDNIFMPKFESGVGCQDIGGGGPDIVVQDNGLFRPYTNDPPRSGFDPNQYIEIRSDGTYRPEQSSDNISDRHVNGGWIQVDENTQYGRGSCNRNSDNDTLPVTFAPRDTPIPERYREAVEGWGFTLDEDGRVTGDTSEDDGEQVADVETCEDHAGPLGWLFCGVLTFLDSLITGIANRIEEELNIEIGWFDQPELENAWTSFRNIAYAILLPVMLIMVITTALGFDAVSAYTVRRALPRIVFAVIFIALSYQALVFVVTLSNELGRGLTGLLQELTFGRDIRLDELFTPDPAQAGLLSTAAVAGGIGAAIAFPMILAFAGVVALSILLGFMVLFLRQALIVMFVVISPVAILMWILPATERLWKMYWGLFWKLLALFPLIAIVEGGAKALGSLLTSTDDGAGSGFFGELFAAVIYIIWPVLALLAASKLGGPVAWAGGALAGMTAGMRKGIMGRGAGATGNRWQAAKSGQLFKGGGVASRGANAAFAAGIHGPKAIGGAVGGLNRGMGWNPRRWRSRLASNARNLPSEIAGRVDQARGKTIDERRRQMQEDPDFAGDLSGDDDLSWATTEALTDNASPEDVLLNAVEVDQQGNRLETEAKDARGNMVDAGGNIVDDKDQALKVPKYRTRDRYQQYNPDTGQWEWKANGRRSLSHDVGRIEGLKKKGYGNKAIQVNSLHSALKGGTAVNTPAGWLSRAADIAGKDDTLLGKIVGDGQKAAMEGGRVDQGGGKFSDTMKIAQDLRDGNIDTEEANKRLARSVIKNKAGGHFANPSVRARAVEFLAPHIRDMADEAAAGGLESYDEFLADMTDIHESMRGSKPEAKRALAEIMGHQTAAAPAERGGPGRSIEQHITAAEQSSSDNEAYRRNRKTLPYYMGAGGAAS